MTAINSPIREVTTKSTEPSAPVDTPILETPVPAVPAKLVEQTIAVPPLVETAPTATSATSNELVHFLLPSFPTSPSAVESTTILSSMVMRRLGGDAKSRNLRPGTASSSGSAKKSIWQSHQLVLTSFRLNESIRGSVVEATAHEPQPSGSRTIAHLHLFSTQPRSKPSTPVKHHTWLSSNEPTEVERRSVAQQTTAGVWNSGADGEEKMDTPDKSRKWVMRISWDDEEWLCDMPTR